MPDVTSASTAARVINVDWRFLSENFAGLNMLNRFNKFLHQKPVERAFAHSQITDFVLRLFRRPSSSAPAVATNPKLVGSGTTEMLLM
jgi:hypothetical protein